MFDRSVCWMPHSVGVVFRQGSSQLVRVLSEMLLVHETVLIDDDGPHPGVAVLRRMFRTQDRGSSAQAQGASHPQWHTDRCPRSEILSGAA
jgi:hypothetical protein